MSVDPADEVQRWYVESWTKTIDFTREVRAETIALLKQPQPEKEAFRLGLVKASERFSEVIARLAGRVGRGNISDLEKNKIPR